MKGLTNNARAYCTARRWIERRGPRAGSARNAGPKLGSPRTRESTQATLCLALHIASLQKLLQDQVTGCRELRTGGLPR